MFALTKITNVLSQFAPKVLQTEQHIITSSPYHFAQPTKDIPTKQQSQKKNQDEQKQKQNKKGNNKNDDDHNGGGGFLEPIIEDFQ